MSLKKQIHQHDGSTVQRQAPVSANIQAPTHEQDVLVDTLAPATHADTLARSPEQVQRLQRTLGNRATERLMSRSVQRDVDSSSIDTKAAGANLQQHVGSKAQQQALIAKNKHGQGMAEALIREGRTDTQGKDAKNEDELKGISDSLRRLVNFTKFDDSASISVLADADKGGLSDEQKWDVIKVNTEFMSYIKPGMTINKIIPESSVDNILKYQHLGKDRTSQQPEDKLGGSVAHKMNYDQGLTGEESVSNFGLDYAAYTHVVNGKREFIDPKAWNTLSPYVKQVNTGKNKVASPFLKQSGGQQVEKERLSSIPNVFYVQMKLPDSYIPEVKVPIHDNIINFALSMQKQIITVLADPRMLSAQATEMGAVDADEVRAMLQKKLDILSRFVDVAKFEVDKMGVAKKANGEKNEDDPLTNLGITKPGARLQNKFGTINQEYYFKDRMDVPEGSGLFLKNSTGKDNQVGKLIQVNGQLQWGRFVMYLINHALKENEEWRRKK